LEKKDPQKQSKLTKLAIYDAITMKTKSHQNAAIIFPERFLGVAPPP